MDGLDGDWLEGHDPSSTARSRDVHRIVFNGDEAEYAIDEIDEDIKKGKGPLAIPEEIQREVMEVTAGEYDNFESFRSRLVTHYAVKKHMIQGGCITWLRPPAPVCVGQKKARFISKLATYPAVTIHFLPI